MSTEDIIASLKEFCGARSIPVNGVLVLTVQENRTTRYSAVVVDFDRGTILPNFPAEMLDAYSETRVGNFLVCYKAQLKVPEGFDADAPDGASTAGEDAPFCCSRITPYKPRKLAAEGVFRDFVAGKGHHPSIVFEVKRQVDNGPLVSTKYYQVLDGAVREVEGNFTQKKHAFKNYKCHEHQLFFGVDLFNASGSGYNFHHMRLNPFTKIDASVLADFFAAAGVR